MIHSKAIILAAGRGERMRPLTDALPKPLLSVGGKPLLVWHLNNLKRAGITDIVINHAHLGEKIESALGDGSRFGVRIRYSAEGEALETAGGIANALGLLGEDAFVVVNGDIFCDYDFAALNAPLARVQHGEARAHLVLSDNPPHHPNGDFGLVDGKLVERETDRLTYTGIGVYHPRLFASITGRTKARLAPILHEGIAAGEISGEHFTGLWRDIGTPERLAELDASLRADATRG